MSGETLSALDFRIKLASFWCLNSNRQFTWGIAPLALIRRLQISNSLFWLTILGHAFQIWIAFSRVLAQEFIIKIVSRCIENVSQLIKETYDKSTNHALTFSLSVVRIISTLSFRCFLFYQKNLAPHPKFVSRPKVIARDEWRNHNLLCGIKTWRF